MLLLVNLMKVCIIIFIKNNNEVLNANYFFFHKGSPLVQDIPGKYEIVVGIFSKNKGCESGKPSIFTRITSYYSWLQKIAGYQPNSCELSLAKVK